MSKKYRSDAMAAIHETVEALHDVGAVDKQTMRRFDDACLTPIRPSKPREIKAIREREHVSQSVFANYLNVTRLAVWSASGSAVKSGLRGPRLSCYRWLRRMGSPPSHSRMTPRDRHHAAGRVRTLRTIRSPSRWRMTRRS